VNLFSITSLILDRKLELWCLLYYPLVWWNVEHYNNNDKKVIFIYFGIDNFYTSRELQLQNCLEFVSQKYLHTLTILGKIWPTNLIGICSIFQKSFDAHEFNKYWNIASTTCMPELFPFTLWYYTYIIFFFLVSLVICSVEIYQRCRFSSLTSLLALSLYQTGLWGIFYIITVYHLCHWYRYIIIQSVL
jgi:hypothetical protein